MTNMFILFSAFVIKYFINYCSKS